MSDLTPYSLFPESSPRDLVRTCQIISLFCSELSLASTYPEKKPKSLWPPTQLIHLASLYPLTASLPTALPLAFSTPGCSCLQALHLLFPLPGTHAGPALSHLFQVFAKMSPPEQDLLSPTGDARPSTPCLLPCFIFLHCHYHYLADMVFDLLGLLWPSLVPLECQLRRARTLICFVH